MLAKWTLETTLAGIAVKYDNLQFRVGMDCGVTEMDAAELLTFMIEEGGGGSEIVMVDGAFAYMLLPEISDSLPSLSLTSGIELQG